MSNGPLEDLIKLLAARLSTGVNNLNVLVQSGIAGHLHANFDRVEGGQNVDPLNDNKRLARIIRPGAILLPNLDIDDNPAVARVRHRHSEADALHDAIVNAADDHQDITRLSIKQPTLVLGNATKVTLRVAAEDAQRIRIWRLPDVSGGDPRHVSVVEVIGPGSAREYVIWDVGVGLLPTTTADFAIEARTLAGDPTLAFAPPAAPVPPPPGKYRLPQPASSGGSEAAPTLNATDTFHAAYGSRMPGDVWVELGHERMGGEPRDSRDGGLFTIAPWIMTWNTLPCQRVYVAYMEAATRPGAAPTFLDALSTENHSMVWELQRGCYLANYSVPRSPPPLPITTARIATHTFGQIRRENDVPFFVIPAAVNGGDRWVQDEFEIGYCYAPHHWLHIVVHTPRGGLAGFVQDHMAHPRMGVFSAVHQSAAGAGGINSISFGGNLEVSPPVPVASPALRRDSGGPAVKAHRPAPFGKIILGDCTPRPNNVFLRNFLFAQRVQPILPVDTSWVAVGHVDEYLSFVRATGPRGFVLLLNNVTLMTILLEQVLLVSPAETIHRGKWRTMNGLEYAEHFVADWLNPAWPNAGPRSLRTYSERVEREKMSRIRARLKAGLDLTEEHIYSIPTYWEVPTDVASALGAGLNQTIAENVGMVNMLVVNDHLMIPRPHGPRLSRADATLVVERVLQRWFGVAAAPPVVLPVVAEEHTFWARPGETTWEIAAYFTRPPPGTLNPVAWRTEIIEFIEGTRPWAAVSGPQQVAIQGIEAVIAPLIAVAGGAVDQFGEWQRLTIPDNTVDVIEVYMLSILQHLGNTVHFVENFESYHAMMGEVHCGTNAKRQPPEVNPGFMDRWWDRGVYDPNYDTTYDPAR